MYRPTFDATDEAVERLRQRIITFIEKASHEPEGPAKDSIRVRAAVSLALSILPIALQNGLIEETPTP